MLGGLLAGAMVGGGQALQHNAQSRLEEKRAMALKQLEQDALDARAARQQAFEAAQADAKFERDVALETLRAGNSEQLAERKAELQAELDRAKADRDEAFAREQAQIAHQRSLELQGVKSEDAAELARLKADLEDGQSEMSLRDVQRARNAFMIQRIEEARDRQQLWGETPAVNEREIAREANETFILLYPQYADALRGDLEPLPEPGPDVPRQAGGDPLGIR